MEEMPEPQLILIDDPAEGVRRITLNRPEKRNALNHALRGGILDLVHVWYPVDPMALDMSGIGFPGGWLHTELRGKQLVYVVHAFNWMGLEPGYFGIMAATQPQHAEQVRAQAGERLGRGAARGTAVHRARSG